MSNEECFITDDIVRRYLEKNIPYFSKYSQEMQDAYIKRFTNKMRKSTKLKDLYLELLIGIGLGVFIIVGVLWYWWVNGANPFRESDREMGVGRIIGSFIACMFFCFCGGAIMSTYVKRYKCKKINLDIERDLKDITAVITNEKIEVYRHRIEKLQKKLGRDEDDNEEQLCIATELLNCLEMMLVAQEFVEQGNGEN
jgi:hypothetical protein